MWPRNFSRENCNIRIMASGDSLDAPVTAAGVRRRSSRATKQAEEQEEFIRKYEEQVGLGFGLGLGVLGFVGCCVRFEMIRCV